MSAADLPVPDRSMDALADYDRAPAAMTDRPCEAAIRAIAAPVVAAVLRKRAGQLEHAVEVGPESPFDDHNWNVVRDEVKMSEAFVLREMAAEIEQNR